MARHASGDGADMDRIGGRQRLLFGAGAVRQVADVIAESGAGNVMLVTGRNSFFLSGAEPSLADFGPKTTLIRFCDFSLNPKLADVAKGFACAQRASCDLILAVGGGSVIDMAKLIAICLAHGCPLTNIMQGTIPIQKKGPTVLAVPTTAGSGAEATHFAVVYDKGRKYSVAHEFLRPDIAVVDPELTYSLPPRFTAVSGLDALCHGVESFWSVNASRASREYSRRVITLALEHLEPAVREPTPKARHAMAWAAHLAGRAIDITKTTAPHAISYAMTSRFGVPHGHAAALTLGPIWVYNSLVTPESANDQRGQRYVRQVMSELDTLLGCADADECCARITGLIEAIGLASRLAGVGIRSAADRRWLRDHVNAERLVNNPRKLAPDTLEEVLKKVA